MTIRPTIAALFALSLAACGPQIDPATRDLGNAAFKGQRSADGTIAPVMTRTVMVGGGGNNAPACAGQVKPARAGVEVRWSPTTDGPPKARLDTEASAFACQREGDWTGVIFPAPGQEPDDCLVTRHLRTARDYQGPCRWGWVRNGDVVAG